MDSERSLTHRRYTVRISHLGRMDIQDLNSTLFVWQPNFHVDFESARTKESFINHIETICHSNQLRSGVKVTNIFEIIHKIVLVEQQYG